MNYGLSFVWKIRKKKSQSNINKFSRFTLAIKKLIFCYHTSLMKLWVNNFGPLLSANSILERRRTKWTEKYFLGAVLIKYKKWWKSKFEYDALLITNLLPKIRNCHTASFKLWSQVKIFRPEDGIMERNNNVTERKWVIVSG